MDLDELRAFLAVVNAGSFLGAAEALGVPRSTLRRRVGSLEARTATPLLKSEGGRVAPTTAGQILVARGKSMLDEASALIASVRSAGGEPSGPLRLLHPVGLPPHVTVPLFASLRERWPALSIRAAPSHAPLAESLLDVDFVVHFGDAPTQGEWLSTVLLDLDERLVVSESFLQRNGTISSVEELTRHPIFVWQSPDEDPLVLPLRDKGELPVQPALLTSDLHFIHQCCLSDLGIGYVPDGSLTDPAYPAARLVPILQHLVGRKRALRISMPLAAAMLPTTKLILQIIQGFGPLARTQGT